MPSPFALADGREFVVIELAVRSPGSTASPPPGALSSEGFLAADESVRSVLRGDDHLVRAMGLTHADLARPLFHVWNLIQTDLALGRWSMPDHQWRNVHAVRYHGHWVALDAHDTKGGQRSPFDDGLEGAFWMVLHRALSPADKEFLRVAGRPHRHRPHLRPAHPRGARGRVPRTAPWGHDPAPRGRGEGRSAVGLRRTGVAPRDRGGAPRSGPGPASSGRVTEFPTLHPGLRAFFMSGTETGIATPPPNTAPPRQERPWTTCTSRRPSTSSTCSPR